MHGAVLEKGQARRTGKVPDICGRDVTDHVESIVDDGDRTKTLVVHKSQGISEWGIGAVQVVRWHVTYRDKGEGGNAGPDLLDGDDFL